MAFSLSPKSKAKAPRSPPAFNDAASIASSAPSEITAAKAEAQNLYATSASHKKTNPSATKADPNRNWEARSSLM